jgi:hypothetical protein
VTRPHVRHANVVVLRPSLGETCRDAVARAAIRAGKLAYRQQRQRDRVRGPLGLVAGYTPSNRR